MQHLATASEDDQPVGFRVYYSTVVASCHWNAISCRFLQPPFHCVRAEYKQLSSFPPSLGDDTSEQVESVALFTQRCARTCPRLVVDISMVYYWSLWRARSTWFSPWLQRLASELTDVTNLQKECICSVCPGSDICISRMPTRLDGIAIHVKQRAPAVQPVFL